MHRTRDIFRRLFKCCFCPKTLNPKKSAKKEARISFPPSHYPPQITQRFIRKRYIIFVLSLVLSLSLSVLIVRFETLSVYIRVSVSRVRSHRVLKKRDVHIIYIIHIRVGREIWIGSTGKKRVSECLGERGRKLKRKCKRKQNAHIISEKEKNGVPNLDRV